MGQPEGVLLTSDNRDMDTLSARFVSHLQLLNLLLLLAQLGLGCGPQLLALGLPGGALRLCRLLGSLRMKFRNQSGKKLLKIQALFDAGLVGKYVVSDSGMPGTQAPRHLH